MLSPNHLYPHLSQKVMSDVTYVIENHLLYDWAISVEYTDDIEYLNTKWNRWGDTVFKIKNSSGVIDNIFSCHTSNPLYAIRLHAERFSPTSSFDFLICSASYNQENSAAKPSCISYPYGGY